MPGGFFRLNYIEKFGTGIQRIILEYEKSLNKPTFIISANAIKVILPVIMNDFKGNEDEKKIYYILKNKKCSSSQLAEESGFGKNKVINILKGLVEKGYVVSEGNGRSIKYYIK